ncbi:hypothetical protein BJ742DRAFT_873676 [Cladochytrium replicatum]|nr:hypothetical protein BJ742DRAFT_873676 [Cladochytrium replicatum]
MLVGGIATVSWIVSWASLTFHSATRALMILLPYLRRVPVWTLSGALVVVQLGINSVGAYYFARSSLPDGTDWEKRTSRAVSVVEAVWYSLVESLLFFATQFKIVATVTEVRRFSNVTKTGLSVTTQESTAAASGATIIARRISRAVRDRALLYFKAFLRWAFFSTSIAMTYLTFGGHLGSTKANNWSSNGLMICIMILMTDSLRFQNALELLQAGEHSFGVNGEGVRRETARVRPVGTGTGSVGVRVQRAGRVESM